MPHPFTWSWVTWVAKVGFYESGDDYIHRDTCPTCDSSAFAEYSEGLMLLTCKMDHA